MARSESSTRTKSDPALLRIKSILVPIDFSVSSKKALEYAVPFARQFGAKLTLLHVVEPVATPDFANSFPLMMENDKVKAASRGQLEHIIKEQGLPQEQTRLRVGVKGGGCSGFSYMLDLTEEAKGEADEEMEVHGVKILCDALLGSTTERVVRHAPCPVLVVREHKHQFITAD